VWSPDHNPNEADANGVVTIEGVTIDFFTAEEVGEQGASLHGIDLISHPDAIIWVKQASLFYAITPANLPWYTDQNANGQYQPIVSFGVCIDEP
jgi:hypothetical protein